MLEPSSIDEADHVWVLAQLACSDVPELSYSDQLGLGLECWSGHIRSSPLTVAMKPMRLAAILT